MLVVLELSVIGLVLEAAVARSERMSEGEGKQGM